MSTSVAGREAARALQRAYWFISAYRVEKALLDLRGAVERKYNPNQPRVPAGNPHGGEWTDGDANVARGGSPIRLAQVRRRVGSGPSIRLGNGKLAEPTPAQAARYEIARSRADALVEEVRQRDPSWHPAPSLTETIEGEILAREGEAREAEAYLGELIRNGQGPGPYAAESLPARGPSRKFRKQERDEINRIGRSHGCHTCGTTEPGTDSGNFVVDHQLPNARSPKGRPQRLYPQCIQCSRRQGNWLSNH